MVETLEGENRYNAEGFGLQDAKKGVIFEEFPPVLHLQLKRFEYDMHRDQNVKINDRHEFPLEIDLEPYLDAKADRSESHLYKLHGVLVHSGDVHGGHYFVLIKPQADGRWLRFDDDRVVPVTDREVLEDNFGGEGPLAPANGGYNVVPPAANVQPGVKPPVKGAMKRFTNAYMLVYVRATRVGEVLKAITTEDVPEHLRTRLERERRDAEQRKRERDEQHLYLTAKVRLLFLPLPLSLPPSRSKAVDADAYRSSARRSSPRTRSDSTRASTSRRSTTAPSRRPTSRRTASRRRSSTSTSAPRSPRTTTSTRTTSGSGSSSTARTRRCGPTRP